MNVKRPGLLFTLVGPAGVGKNQLMKHVLSNTLVRQIPTATTRERRPTEVEGREHLFVEPAEFQQMIDNGALLEWQQVHDRHYGMVRSVVETALDSGQPIIADIDALGAIYVAEQYPENTVGIFIQPPDFKSLIDRMKGRGDELSNISKRLLRVPMELELASKFDYLIVNDDLDQASNALLDIVTSELDRRGQRSAQIQVHMPHAFRYCARVLPVYRDEVACREEVTDGSSFPTAAIGRGDQPVEAALRALREELGIELSTDNLEHGDVTGEGYVSPLSLDYALHDGVEYIIYTYVYRLDDRIALPPGWAWCPIPADTLPPVLVDALQRA